MLFRSLISFSLGRDRLDPEHRRLLVQRLAFGNSDWHRLENVEPPLFMLPSQDPVVLALRRLVFRNTEGLGACHRHAVATAGGRLLGFLHLVLAEAINAPERPPGPSWQRLLPLHVFFSVTSCCAPDDSPDRADLLCRGFAEVARRLIAKGDRFWRNVLLLAWSEWARGSGDRELHATLFETLARGRELQGRLADAENAFAASMLALEDCPIPGRYSEALAAYADFLSRSGLIRSCSK